MAKDPDRPFIVNIAGFDVRAVGTVFSVKLSKNEVDVIVTEGIVNVQPSASVAASLILGQALPRLPAFSRAE